MKKLAPLALIAALALAGCTAGNQSTDATPSATSAASASPSATPSATVKPSAAESKAKSPRQAWADEMIDMYLKTNGAASFKGFFEGSPDREISEWSSPRPGELSVVIKGDNWKLGDTKSLSLRIVDMIQWEAKDLESVTVSTADKKHSSECFPNVKRGNQATVCA
ncbi:hypothetical protein ACT3UQ_19530 [Glutamicibacter sp. AOP12-B1-11]|uniref:hypothetical protein n=1 Tax=Glutamicibacter sp. AOP12-B1-11 TaxID=3457725 RepID=UPI0040336DD9